MAHVLILREAVSFVQGKDLVYGTHEIVEQNINKRLYVFNAARQGYCQPTSSQFILLWYRVKKECIPDFLRDLHAVNLYPKKLPKGFWQGIFFNKQIGQLKQFGFGRLQLFIMVLLRLVPCIKGMDKSEGTPQKFNEIEGTNLWCYNFFLGCIEDKDNEMGEEL